MIRTRTQTILIFISILLGVGGVVAQFTAGDLLVAQLRENFDEDSLAMLNVYVTTRDETEPDDAALLAALAEIPGVTVVEGGANYAIEWRTADDDAFESGTVLAPFGAFADVQLGPVYLLAGQYPVAGNLEIMLDQRFADQQGLTIGDQLTVRKPPPALDNAGVAGPETQWTISGIAYYPFLENQRGGNNPAGVLITTYADAQAMTGDVGLSTIRARFVDYATAKEQVDVFSDMIADESPYYPLYSSREDPPENYQIAARHTMQTSAQRLAVIILIVAGVLALNMGLALVAVDPRWLVVVGALAAIFGMLGGLVIGVLAARRLIDLSDLVLDDVALSASTVGPGLLAGLAVPVVALLAWGLGVIGRRVFTAPTVPDPSAAETDHPLLTARQQRISRGVRRYWHLAFTVLTLTVAVGAVMGVGAVPVSIDQMQDDFAAGFNVHFGITPRDSSNLPAAEAIIGENYPDLINHGVANLSSIDVNNRDDRYDEIPVAIVGLDWPTTAFNFTYTAGGGLEQNPSGIVLARPVADFTGKAVGDTYSLTTYGDILNNTDFVVAGIADFPGPYMWFDWREISRLVGNLDAEGNPLPTTLLFALPDDDPTAAEVDDVVRAISDDLLAQDIDVWSSMNVKASQEGLADIMAVRRTLVLVATLLLCLVAGVGLIAVLLLEDRTSVTWLRWLASAFTLGVIPWLIGLPISVLLYGELIDSLNLGNELVFDYPPLLAIIVLLVMVALILLANWLVSMGRQTPVD